MTYIKLEDVQKTIQSCGKLDFVENEYQLWQIRQIFLSLPTINPESLIEEMIEDEVMCECSISRIRTLEDVLGKIKGVPPDRMELS